MKNKIDVSLMSNPTKVERNKEIKYIKEKEKNIISEILSDYCQTSTLHGISYLGAKDKSLIEKIWWVIMFMLSVAACSYLITKTWIKWKTSPVILSFEKEQVPIWEIPFPAVTICPINKVRQTDYDYTTNFRDKEKTNFTADEVKKFWDISLVCKLRDTFSKDIEYPTDYNFTDELAIDNIRMVAPSLDTVNEVLWQNNIEKGLFTEQLTEEGVCFTFNSLGQEDMYTKEINHNIVYINHSVSNQGWTMEDGYLPEVSINTHPRRTPKHSIAKDKV